MNIFGYIYGAASVCCGIGADICELSEKGLEAGHYAAKGLRITADVVDSATDTAQSVCHAGCEGLNTRASVYESKSAACSGEKTGQTFVRLQKELKEMQAAEQNRPVLLEQEAPAVVPV